MYDIRWIRDNEARFEAGRRARGLEPLAGRLFALDDVRRAAIVQLQAAQERRNAASKDIGQAMKDKDSARADALKAEVKVRTGERDALQMQYEGFRKTLRDMLGSADTAVGKMNLPLTQPTATTIGTARN